METDYLKSLGGGSDGKVMAVTGSDLPDFFSTSPLTGPAPGALAPSPPPRAARSWIRAGLILTACGALVTMSAWWWTSRGDLPTAQPPPQGGTFEAPETLGGLPRVQLVQDELINRFQRDHPGRKVLVESYAGPGGSGGMFLVIVEGPASDLWDLKAASGEITTVGATRCADHLHAETGTTEVDIAATTCWRSTGEFSLSVLGPHIGVDQVRTVVDEAWASQ